HLSMWWKGVPIIIDPGTGTYFSDAKLRAELAGWEDHNGPRLERCGLARRLGTFMWGRPHARPVWSQEGDIVSGRLAISEGILERRIAAAGTGWEIHDSFK